MRIFILMISFIIGCVFPSEAFAEKHLQKKEGESFQFFTNLIAGPEEANIEIYLTNDGNETLKFEASTSQWYEIIIENDKNEIVYEYSKDKYFLQALQYLPLQPDQTKVWVETWKYPDRKMISSGKYTVTVQLKAKLINNKRITLDDKFVTQKVMIIPPENPILKNIEVKEVDNSFIVSGNARPTTNNLFYIVEDGHHEWIKETKVKMESKYPEWVNFSLVFKLPKEKYPGHLPLVLYLYEKDKSGNIIHTYPKLLKH